MILSKTLQNIRLANGMSQAKMAEIVGVHPSTYANYEQGRREPDYQTVLKICDYFNISLDSFFGRKAGLDVPKYEKKPLYKSDIHEEVFNMINVLDKEDLLMLKGYLIRLLEKYEKVKGKEIG